MDAQQVGLSPTDFRRLLWASFGSVAGGVVLVAAFAVQGASTGSGVQIFSTAVMVGGAAFGIGTLLEFLFAIPRARTSEGGAGRTTDRGAYLPNTNLEQISDWLTKILVGVGLTQLTSMPERLQALGTGLAPAFGSLPTSETFALATVLYFLLTGFMLAFLWTRLFMPGVLTKADISSQRVLAAAAGLAAAEGAQEVRLQTLQSTAALVRGATAAGKDVSEIAEGLTAVAEQRATLDEVAARMGPEVAAELQMSTSSRPPLAEGRVEHIANEVSAAAAADAGRGASVLWVDDRPENNTYEARALEAVGIRITYSRSTADAQRVLRQTRFDAVITDLGRGLDRDAGLRLVEWIRRELGPQPPVFCYAGQRGVDMADTLRQRGAQGVASNPQELFSMVTRATAARQS